MELEIIMLSQSQRSNIICSHTSVEPRPEMKMTVMNFGHEYVWEPTLEESV
jgi:hypothetical protein